MFCDIMRILRCFFAQIIKIGLKNDYIVGIVVVASFENTVVKIDLGELNMCYEG